MEIAGRHGGKFSTRWVRLLVPAIALVLAPPTSAHAERSAHSDPAGDLVDLSAEVMPGEEFPEAPEVLTGDIIRFVGAHRRRSVKMSIQMRELPHQGQIAVTTWAIITPGRHFEVSVLKRPDRRRHIVMSRIRSGVGERMRCAGLRYERHPATERIILTVPRRCIKHPAWVRVRAWANTREDNADYHDSAIRWWRDVPHLARG